MYITGLHYCHLMSLQMILLHAALVVTEDSKLITELTHSMLGEMSISTDGGFTRLLVYLTREIRRGLTTAFPADGSQTEGGATSPQLLLLCELLSSLLVLLPRAEGLSLRERLVSARGTAGETDTGTGTDTESASESSGIIPGIIESMKCILDNPVTPPKEFTQTSESYDAVNTLLQLLGNLLFGCPCAQDLLRECGGLFRVLSLCHTNVSQPLRREWAVLCLRNACEGNAENQSCIEQLTLQKVEVVNEDLRRSGLQADFNQTSGKIEFSYKS